MVKCKYWSKLNESTISCNLCPRKCEIKNGKHGFCFARKNINGQLTLISNNKASAVANDPVEKKPLNHFLPGSYSLSVGSIGCNLNCSFCQNHHISRSQNEEDLKYNITPGELIDMAKKANCQSISFTYNEPIVTTEFVQEVANLSRKNGLKNIAVTAGYINEKPRKDFFELMDGVNIDLKSFNKEFYNKFCNIEFKHVLDSIEYVASLEKIWLELTTLLIEGENDSNEELNQLTSWIVKTLGANIPIHFSSFHPSYKVQDRPRTSINSLNRARDIAVSNGMNYVYTGNVENPKGTTTFCSKCNSTLIERSWFGPTSIKLVNKNECPKCKEICPGLF